MISWILDHLWFSLLMLVGISIYFFLAYKAQPPLWPTDEEVREENRKRHRNAAHHRAQSAGWEAAPLQPMKSLAGIYALNLLDSLDLQARQDMAMYKKWCITFLLLSLAGAVTIICFWMFTNLTTWPFAIVETILIVATAILNRNRKQWCTYLENLRNDRALLQ